MSLDVNHINKNFWGPQFLKAKRNPKCLKAEELHNI